MGIYDVSFNGNWVEDGVFLFINRVFIGSISGWDIWMAFLSFLGFLYFLGKGLGIGDWDWDMGFGICMD